MGPGEVIDRPDRRRPADRWSWLMLFHRWFQLQGEEARGRRPAAAEKAAQYAAEQRRARRRVRVLEQIVTDGGAQTAAQIEALRDKPRLPSGDKVQ